MHPSPRRARLLVRPLLLGTRTFQRPMRQGPGADVLLAQREELRGKIWCQRPGVLRPPPSVPQASLHSLEAGIFPVLKVVCCADLVLHDGENVLTKLETLNFK